VEIIFHAHNAIIPEPLKGRAERAVLKFGRRLQRAVDAVVRFEDDGPTRRVEIVLHAPQHRNLVAEGRSRSYATALKDALARLQAGQGVLVCESPRWRRGARDDDALGRPPL